VAAISTGTAAFLIVLILPSFIGRWMGVVRLEDQRLLRRIEDFRAVVGIRRLDPAVVPSQGRWSGAAVVGWLPGFRKLWLGDVLLEQLDSKELDMVILHEIAHVKRWHVVWRSLPIVWTLGLVAIYWTASEMLPPDAIPLWAGRTFCLLAATGTLLIGLGQVSRNCELDADYEACRLADRACDWAKEGSGKSEEVMVQALRNILGNSREAARRTWLHPSLRERVSSLAKRRASEKQG
jgi:Zn-dependent protease with chaperone function